MGTIRIDPQLLTERGSFFSVGVLISRCCGETEIEFKLLAAVLSQRVARGSLWLERLLSSTPLCACHSSHDGP